MSRNARDRRIAPFGWRAVALAVWFVAGSVFAAEPGAGAGRETAIPADATAAAVTATAAVELPPALTLEEVLQSVANQYPPYLAALIQRDIAEGRLRSAGAAFDLGTFARVFGNPQGYYEYATVETGVEQFLGLWGATIFGSYRLTDGDTLPDYYGQRTERGGEARLGLRLPLLQDGSIDQRRAAILRARLDKELVNPTIRRQQLDFLRAGAVAYHNWVASGLRLAVAEEILRVARDRQDAIGRQIERGLSAPIVLQENQQLVVSREIRVVRARRSFEAAALALSLFTRNTQDRPVVPGRERLPDGWMAPVVAESEPDMSALEAALARRPEIRQLELTRERSLVDLRVAKNGLLPRLDAGAEAIQGLGDERYADRGEFELKLGLEFRMPLQQNQARGNIQETQGRLEQLDRQLGFARDRVLAEIRNTYEAVVAAWEQVQRAGLNVQLARTLQSVEEDRFKLGAADLLALQIREQNAVQARFDELDALEQYHVSRTDLLTALATDLK
ncbi:MAG: TolC family protein [Limisphaerales bacterium]